MEIRPPLSYLLLAVLLLPACSSWEKRKEGRGKGAMESCLRNFSPAHESQGWASWYGGKFHGRRTASGERYDQNALTAAHRTYSFGTLVEVKNLCSDQTVTVRINDRGPSSSKRLIDVSLAAAKALGMIGVGIVPVELQPQ